MTADKDKSEQDVKLQQTKDKLKNDKDEFERKLNAGEFEDNKKVVLTKTDQELAKLQVEKNKVEANFRKKQEQLRNDNKGFIRRLAETAKSTWIASLIIRPTTYAKDFGISSIAPCNGNVY